MRRTMFSGSRLLRGRFQSRRGDFGAREFSARREYKIWGCCGHTVPAKSGTMAETLCLLVFTGESSEAQRWWEMHFVHPQYVENKLFPIANTSPSQVLTSCASTLRGLLQAVTVSSHHTRSPVSVELGFGTPLGRRLEGTQKQASHTQDPSCLQGMMCTLY